MTSRPRTLLLAVLILALAVAGLSAQEKVPMGESPPPAAPPAKVNMAAAPGPGNIVVSPGPEPWYTVFGTGEAIGFIEPCG